MPKCIHSPPKYEFPQRSSSVENSQFKQTKIIMKVSDAFFIVLFQRTLSRLHALVSILVGPPNALESSLIDGIVTAPLLPHPATQPLVARRSATPVLILRRNWNLTCPSLRQSPMRPGLLRMTTCLILLLGPSTSRRVPPSVAISSVQPLIQLMPAPLHPATIVNLAQAPVRTVPRTRQKLRHVFPRPR